MRAISVVCKGVGKGKQEEEDRVRGRFGKAGKVQHTGKHPAEETSGGAGETKCVSPSS